MIKKTIKFTDYNGTEVTRDFYFHLSKMDFIELSADTEFEKLMNLGVRKADKLAIVKGFKKLIGMSVGMRSEDGSDFTRTEAFRDQFMSSPALDELVMELFTSEDGGVSFIKGLVPANMTEQLVKEMEKVQSGDKTVDPFADEPAWIREQRIPTPQEFAAATDEQKKLAFSRKLGSQA